MPQARILWRPRLPRNGLRAGTFTRIDIAPIGCEPGRAPIPRRKSHMSSTDLRILAGGGIAVPLREIAVLFERATGRRVAIHFGTTPELIKEATSGAPFDCGVTPREVFASAEARARFASGPTQDVARVGLGVAVRAGAPKPSIATADALKAALIEARSIATIPASAAGAQVMRLFDRLGIAEAMNAKLKIQKAPPDIVQAVASGEADLGMFLANVFIAQGVELLRPFPPELQQEVVFTSAISAQPPSADGARAFLDFLTTSAVTAVLTEKGMEPVRHS